MAELSKWGEHFGQALCLSPERAVLPLDELTPSERQCVEQVGLSAQRSAEEKRGAPSPTPVATYSLRGNTGEVGQLKYVDGVVSLCLHDAHGQQHCQVIGDGSDAVAAAVNVLRLFGIEANPSGGA